jgi:ATP synthase protein I
MSNHGASRPVPALVVAGPTAAPWLEILRKCTVAVALLAAIMVLTALMTGGAPEALSALFGSAVVVLFFSISLAVGHFAGRDNPSGALGLFVAVYALKVVGFAGVLYLLGVPAWLERTWFFAAAVGTVIVWQIVEVYVFSRMRHQLYDPAGHRPAGGAGNEHAR